MTQGMMINLKHFEIHDGPGIRTTLFLKGCPLHCKWCHNPESWSMKPQLALYEHKCVQCGRCQAVCPLGVHEAGARGHIMHRERCIHCGACERSCPTGALSLFGHWITPGQVLSDLLEDEPFYVFSGGGVTISGGEPLLQCDFTAELLHLLKEKGVHTAVDTSLYAAREALEKTMADTDLYLIDVKAIDPALHRRCTGVDNGKILDNLRYIDSLQKPYEIRVPLIPGENDGEIVRIADYLCSLEHIGRVKLLAYHDLARTKYAALGEPYAMGNTPVPSEAMYEQAFSTLRAAGLEVIHK